MRAVSGRRVGGGVLFVLAAGLGLAAWLGQPPELPPAPPPLLDAKALAPRFPRWKQLLLDYLAIDTTNPPGDERKAFPLLTGALSELGLTSTVAALGPNRGNILARLEATNPDPGARPLILLHHIDVVPVETDRWTVPAFSALERDGRIYGRGAIDIKHLGVVQLAALERLAKVKDRLRRDVIFLAVSDEEQSGAGAQLAVERWLDTYKPEYLLDEGGFGIRKFMNDRDLVVIATTQKRVTRLRLTAQGEAGHGSRPIENSGPNILREALVRLAAAPPEVRLLPTTKVQFERLGVIAGFPKNVLLANLSLPPILWALEGKLTSDKNLNPSLRDTMSLTILEAGHKDNVIPAEATAIFDVRLLPDTRSSDFLARVRGIIGDLPVKAELTYEPLPEMAEAPIDDPLYRAIEDSVRAHAPGAVVSPWLCVGATDSRFFAPHGVKTYGFLSVFVTKAQIDTIHGHDENLDVAELEAGIVVYAEALERFLVRPE